MSQSNKQVFFAILAMCLCLINFDSAHAVQNEHYSVDLYRSTQVTREQIAKRFGKQFEKMYQSDFMKDGRIDNDLLQQNGKAMLEIISGIKTMGHFSYINISPIGYPGTHRKYYTVDLVDKQDDYRLQYFKPKPNQDIPDPAHLIKRWKQYEAEAIGFLFKRSVPHIYDKCPVFHCVDLFDLPDEKPYLTYFNQEVPKHQAELVKVLREDKDDQKRAAAAFLLAHIKNGNELIHLLAPSIYDPSSFVRNNVMRVFAVGLPKMNHPTFPIQDVVTALEFPSETDRNKAIAIISELMKQPRYQNYIKQHALALLIDNLKMSQPNLHEFAYGILVEISHKKYAERDYVDWENWVKQTKHQFELNRA